MNRSRNRGLAIALGVALITQAARAQPYERFGLAEFIKTFEAEMKARGLEGELTPPLADNNPGRSAGAGGWSLRLLPTQHRQLNLTGDCVHCSTVHLLHQFGLHAEADQWWDDYRRGEWPNRHTERMEKAGFVYAVTTNGDEKFLDWACGNLDGARRGAGVVLMGAHMLNLIDLDPETVPDPKAYIFNNWQTTIDDSHAETWPRKRFITDWKRRGGWAFTILANADGEGRPPLPYPADPEATGRWNLPLVTAGNDPGIFVQDPLDALESIDRTIAKISKDTGKIASRLDSDDLANHPAVKPPAAPPSDPLPIIKAPPLADRYPPKETPGHATVIREGIKITIPSFTVYWDRGPPGRMVNLVLVADKCTYATERESIKIDGLKITIAFGALDWDEGGTYVRNVVLQVDGRISHKGFDPWDDFKPVIETQSLSYNARNNKANGHAGTNVVLDIPRARATYLRIDNETIRDLRVEIPWVSYRGEFRRMVARVLNGSNFPDLEASRRLVQQSIARMKGRDQRATGSVR